MMRSPSSSATSSSCLSPEGSPTPVINIPSLPSTNPHVGANKSPSTGLTRSPNAPWRSMQHFLQISIVLMVLFGCCSVFLLRCSLDSAYSHHHQELLQEHPSLRHQELDVQLHLNSNDSTDLNSTFNTLRTNYEVISTDLPSREEPLYHQPPKVSSSVSTTDRSDKCYEERDFGIIDQLRVKARRFCWASESQAVQSSETSITYFNASGGLKATQFTNLMLDFTNVRIDSPIKSLAQDGGGHDPRFVFSANLIHCNCSQVPRPKLTSPRLDFWDATFTKRGSSYEPTSLCLSPETLDKPTAPSSNRLDDKNSIVLHEKVILLPRRDDHNPFFQISAALNAWILMQTLRWDETETRLVQLDGGYETPTDELQHKVLAPNFEMLRGSTLMGKKLYLDSALLTPFEGTGPMMQHLNDNEPCGFNQLISNFRDVSMQRLGVSQFRESATCMVTIITRRAYSGRNVQRKWLNEDEVLLHMQQVYSDVPCVIQSIEFVGLPMAEQMRIIKESDVVIGMHGAGMVNVMWTRPGTPVIEIFPLKRKRWGYRNLCQFIGCDWHEFRGGKDTGRGDNASDKRIPPAEWMEFFDPIFQSVVSSKPWQS